MLLLLLISPLRLTRWTTRYSFTNSKNWFSITGAAPNRFKSYFMRFDPGLVKIFTLEHGGAGSIGPPCITRSILDVTPEFQCCFRRLNQDQRNFRKRTQPIRRQAFHSTGVGDRRLPEGEKMCPRPTLLFTPSSDGKSLASSIRRRRRLLSDLEPI